MLVPLLALPLQAHAKGSSLMQPLIARTPAKSGADLSSEAFATLAESQVNPADLFFHKYYNLSAVRARKALAKKRKRDGEDNDDSDGSLEDADDDELDEFMEDQEKVGRGAWVAELGCNQDEFQRLGTAWWRAEGLKVVEEGGLCRQYTRQEFVANDAWLLFEVSASANGSS